MSAAALRETQTPTRRCAAHQQARDAAFGLIVELQLTGTLDAAQIAEIVTTGETNDWGDVIRLGLYLGALRACHTEGLPASVGVEQLLAHAERDHDPTMTALALALRAQDRSITAGRAPVDADRDLARATALLEDVSGPSTEAVCAHLQCGVACEPLDMWELQVRHYDAAEARLDPDETPAHRLATLLYNRAEVQLNWAAALRERGAMNELAERAAQARLALRAAEHPALPAAWREELDVFRELLDAISPPPEGLSPVTRAAEGEYTPYVHLTRALRTTDLAQARRHCELAVETMDVVRMSCVHLFALSYATELEAAAAGGATAGLRLARQLIARRWERRQATVASLQSLIDVERVAAEHAELRQHAYLDDLTGVGNRRALTRFAEGLRARGVRAVSAALVDLDRFKQINDTHGHAVGDAALSRVATVLRAGVRDGDLVVRLGGDEFLLLLTTPHLAAGRRRCEAIMRQIAGTCWDDVTCGLTVSASCGVAHGELRDLQLLQASADAALYRAKLAGRGRVSI